MFSQQNRLRHLPLILASLLLALCLTARPLMAQPSPNPLMPQTVGCVLDAIVCRISVASAGAQGNDTSSGGYISSDGRYIMFRSDATNLVAGDTNDQTDIFVHDRQTGQTTRVSVATGGGQANIASEGGAISSNGRYIAFNSPASNLVAGDTDHNDTFVHDRQLGETSRVSVTSAGVQGNAPSVWGWAISADGRYVAFVSLASNLVPGDTNGDGDVFVRDRQTGQTTRVSVASGGAGANAGSSFAAMSADGRYVGFVSLANNLVAWDTNLARDVFVHDRTLNQTTRVSTTTDGGQGDGDARDLALSADGRYVVFSSDATRLVPDDTNGMTDMFVHDRQTGQTTRVSVTSSGGQSSAFASGIAISADGRYVGFNSLATNLVAGDTNNFLDAFVHDRQTGRTRRVSVTPDGTQGNQHLYLDSLSADGRYVVYGGAASNLVAGDTNNAGDVFVVDWQRLPLTNNGGFNDPINTGMGNWNVFAVPGGAAVSRVENGVFEFYSQPGAQQAVLVQSTGQPVAANTGLNVQLDLGNSSPNRKRVSVLVHDASFTDLQICTFWLPPNTALRTYTMQARTTRAWTNASLSIYANTADGAGWYQVDNATLTETQGAPPPSTLCTDPGAPPAPGSADSANLVANSDFSTTIPLPNGDSSGNWWSFAGIVWQQVSGELQTYRPSGSLPGGVMIQNTGAAIPSGMPLEATMQLGNNSATYRYVKVIVHDADFTDFGVCAFWLPPNTPLYNYAMRIYTTEAWTNATVAIYPNPAYPSGWIRTDNVALRQRPGLTLTGTQCYELGAFVPAPRMDAPTAPTVSEPPALPPGELPLIATPAPYEAQRDADGEGEFSE